jgi:hypothetical protein
MLLVVMYSGHTLFGATKGLSISDLLDINIDAVIPSFSIIILEHNARASCVVELVYFYGPSYTIQSSHQPTRERFHLL